MRLLTSFLTNKFNVIIKILLSHYLLFDTSLNCSYKKLTKLVENSKLEEHHLCKLINPLKVVLTRNLKKKNPIHLY